MKSDTPRVQRRTIGKVNIFDVLGNLEGELVSGIKDYISSYIKECKMDNVILNIQSVRDVDSDIRSSFISILEIPKKTAIYYDSQDNLQKFIDLQSKKIFACTNQKELLKIFGKEFVERDKTIKFEERRRTVRFKTSLDAEIDFIDKDGNIINSTAIVTNLSENGLFAEYFDLKSALKINDFDYFKNIKVKIRMQNPQCINADEIEKLGNILRIEFNSNQIGIAIEFN